MSKTIKNKKCTGPMCQECKTNGIDRRASYGYDDKRYVWCSSCSKEQYVKLGIEESRRVDTHTKCTKCMNSQPRYGYDGNKRVWCEPCSRVEYKRLEIAEDRRCDGQPKCQRCKKSRPHWGFDGKTNLWCTKCAMIEYEQQQIDEKRQCNDYPLCLKCNKKQRKYGYDDNHLLWCLECAQIQWKELGIDDERRCNGQKLCRRCESIRPTYGFDDQYSIWCENCADIEYKKLNISKERQNNSHPNCIICNNLRPHYGYDGNPYMYCRTCSLKEYERLGISVDRQCDSLPKCAFVFPDGTNCIVSCGRKDLPFCSYHDTTRIRRRKNKEMQVVDYLRKVIGGNLQHNKIEYVDCGNVSLKYYFPDITWDCGSWIIHVEVDEQQHKTYSCECQRIMELAQCRLEVSTFLIRYNPDTMHLDGTNWKWKYKDRLKVLERVIRWAMSDEGGQECRRAWEKGQVLTIYLFYDDKMCLDQEGVWPGQIHYSSLKDCQEGSYMTQQIHPDEIGLKFS